MSFTLGKVLRVKIDSGTYCGDARRLPLRDESVALCVTSPPYPDAQAWTSGGIGNEPDPKAYLAELYAVAKECWRVLAPWGSMFVNLGDRYAQKPGQTKTRAVGASSALHGRRPAIGSFERTGFDAGDIRPQSLMGLPWRYALGLVDGEGDPAGRGWLLRAEVIWHKRNALPSSADGRVARTHEQWFHFTKTSDHYGNIAAVPDVDEFEGRAPTGRRWRDRSRKSGDAAPGSVWAAASDTSPAGDLSRYGLEDHELPPAFPQEMVRRCILGWTPDAVCVDCALPADWCGCEDSPATSPAVVLDPFAGRGTTAGVASALGRVGVQGELDRRIAAMAADRAGDVSMFAQTVNRTAAEAQGDLFDVREAG